MKSRNTLAGGAVTKLLQLALEPDDTCTLISHASPGIGQERVVPPQNYVNLL